MCMVDYMFFPGDKLLGAGLITSVSPMPSSVSGSWQKLNNYFLNEWVNPQIPETMVTGPLWRSSSSWGRDGGSSRGKWQTNQDRGADSLTFWDQQCGGEGLGRGPLNGGQLRLLPRAPSGTTTGFQDQYTQRSSASKALTSRTWVDAWGGVQGCQANEKEMDSYLGLLNGQSGRKWHHLWGPFLEWHPGKPLSFRG